MSDHKIEDAFLAVTDPSKYRNIDIVSILQSIGDTISKIWHYPIINIGSDTIEVSNILIALLIFFLGIRLRKFTIQLFHAHLKKVNNIDPNLRKSLEKIFDYLLLIIIALVALKISNVPLTAFTFIGGALAIGIGLASQNILNNFISGLIILFEQPIRIGDIITIGQDTGTVVSIGARCTQIITFDNLDLLIPNSYLLQNTITNLTLTDGGIVKTRVNIPVSCRSNPDNVIKLILHILQKHPNILQYPDPEVNIKEINDNQIIYEASFFADLFGKIPRRKIITEVYSEVFKLFFQNNVEVLKPQAFINWE